MARAVHLGFGATMTLTTWLLLLIAVVIVLLLWSGRGGRSDAWPFVLRPHVMSPPERKLHERLVRALPEHVVLAQVQVSRVLDVQPGAETHAWLNRINRLSYDFVVCRRSGAPIAAIELDDASHELPERQEADQRKDKATQDAGLVMIRWHVKAMPDEAEIRRQVLAAARKLKAAGR